MIRELYRGEGGEGGQHVAYLDGVYVYGILCMHVVYTYSISKIHTHTWAALTLVITVDWAKLSSLPTLPSIRISYGS